MRRALPSLLLIAALAWATLLIAAPAYVASGVNRTLTLSAASIYAAGSFICHQRPERSFRVQGVRMPVCARCAALYLAAPFGIALALAGVWPAARRRPDALRRWLIAASLPIVATLLVEWAGSAQPGNAVRAVSAVPLGVLVGWLVTSAARGEIE